MTLALVSQRRGFTPGANRELRRQIDKSVSRALVDSEYARQLLVDPTIALEQTGCPPQQFRSLRGIHATDVIDFAQQAHALFWRVEPKASRLEEQLPLAAAAAR
jgi:hypothetical protein